MTQNTLKILGDNIRLFRISNKWSQQELAEKAKISDKEVSHIEKGQRNITINTLTKIAHAFNIDPAVLLIKNKDAYSTLLNRNKNENN